MELTFVIPGDPVGFVSSGHNRWSKAQGKAWEYKKYINDCTPEEIKRLCETSAKTKTHVLVKTTAYFRTHTHPDPENVHKIVKDALFYGVGDKYTGGQYDPPLYDKNNPRVVVTVILLLS